MAITWRVPVLVLLGIGPLLLRPAAGTAWAWIGLVVLLVVADVLLAPARSTLSVVRREVGRARQGEATSTTLEVVAGSREVRGILRDAWQPSAGATGNRHRLRPAPARAAGAHHRTCGRPAAVTCGQPA